MLTGHMNGIGKEVGGVGNQNDETTFCFGESSHMGELEQ